MEEAHGSSPKGFDISKSVRKIIGLIRVYDSTPGQRKGQHSIAIMIIVLTRLIAVDIHLQEDSLLTRYH